MISAPVTGPKPSYDSEVRVRTDSYEITGRHSGKFHKFWAGQKTVIPGTSKIKDQIIHKSTVSNKAVEVYQVQW